MGEGTSGTRITVIDKNGGKHKQDDSSHLTVSGHGGKYWEKVS